MSPIFGRRASFSLDFCSFFVLYIERTVKRFSAIPYSYHFGFEHFPVGPGRAVALVYGEAAYRACLGAPFGLFIVGLPTFWPGNKDDELVPLLRKLASRAVVVWAEGGGEGLQRALRHGELLAAHGARAVGVFNPGFQPQRPRGDVTGPDIAALIASTLRDADALALPAQGRLAGRAVVPWVAAVDAATLLAELRTLIGRYLTEAEDALDAIALWCLHTWRASDFAMSPRLVLLANDARADHGSALRLIGWLTPSPLLVARAVAAHLLPAIETEQPTLLIDDVAGGMLYRRDMRTLLAAGAHPDGTFLSPRTKRNPTGVVACFCPAAIATTAILPDDLRARSIVVPMTPTPAGVARKALTFGEPPAEVLRLRAQMQAFAASIGDLPKRPMAHAAWQPLLSLATLFGNAAAEHVTCAMVRLAGALPAPASNLALLADIRALAPIGEDSGLATVQLIETLTADVELPWARINRGRKLDARELSERLRPFGLRPATLRLPNGGFARGYRAEDLADAFSRYLGPQAAITSDGKVAAM